MLRSPKQGAPKEARFKYAILSRQVPVKLSPSSLDAIAEDRSYSSLVYEVQDLSLFSSKEQQQHSPRIIESVKRALDADHCRVLTSESGSKLVQVFFASAKAFQ